MKAISVRRTHCTRKRSERSLAMTQGPVIDCYVIRRSLADLATQRSAMKNCNVLRGQRPFSPPRSSLTATFRFSDRSQFERDSPLHHASGSMFAVRCLSDAESQYTYALIATAMVLKQLASRTSFRIIIAPGVLASAGPPLCARTSFQA